MGRAALQELFTCRQYLRNARLIVRAQKRGAVGRDERFSLQLFQERELGRFQYAAALRQGHVAAIIILMQNGLHILAGECPGPYPCGRSSRWPGFFRSRA